MRDAGLKKRCIVFSKGKGLVGGWVFLVKKLHILEVELRVNRPGGGAGSEGRRVKAIR